MIWLAGGGIAALAALAMLGPAILSLYGKDTAAQGLHADVGPLLNALLPLFGTWVGTVLAYYFSKDNFQAASESTKAMSQALIGQLDQKLKSIKITDAWIPYDQIVGIHLDDKTTEKTVTVEQMEGLLSDKVTRIAVFSATKAIQYLIHASAIYKYGYGKPDVAKDTLEKLVNDTVMKPIVKTFAIAAFSADGTLADAKVAMDGTSGAQDVFLTSHGKPDEPVMGWITNVIIADKSKA